MFKQVQDELVKRLTSGKYKQARGKLKRIDPDGPRHCCLGVLCEIHAEETGGKFLPNEAFPVSRRDETGIYGGGATYLGKDGMPPEQVLKWSGLTFDEARSLANKNDAGAHFKQIASVISKLPTERLVSKTIRWANQYGRGTKRVKVKA